MNIYADVLIVGTGIAGMYSALNLRKDLNIVMITKSTIEESNSYLAQGGISTAKNEKDKAVFIQDTLKAGIYINDITAVELLAAESRENIKNLTDFGVEFDKAKDGFDYTKEGAHSINRIVHCADETGRKVSQVLIEQVKVRENIKIYENTCCIDILKESNNCKGAVVLKGGNLINIYAKTTILACGGIGGLFKNSTNQRSLIGSGLGIAIRNNIAVKDMNYIQFHPTALYEGETEGKRFLISESLRGEGAILVNKYGDRFVDELLPRNVVAEAILEEQKKTNSRYVYLDITHMPAQFIINRFPCIYKECKKRGLDIIKERIPVTPAQHYFMGGIKVDNNSKTSMKNLFACGEASCTGVHGANRLASNSLLEALVFSRRAAIFINKVIDGINVNFVSNYIHYNQALEINTLNKKIVINEFMRIRGDIKDELVSC
ncbi:L-aspartate oxidase [Clostridium sp. ZS2-4]|uniref:L-aspartate oxidase n=1 Tax=Clostridium sp. ZS2-4 TaxID=2987703 RepID=UPI00227C99C5|nr:L-aspartate oxidase [Clostridium sp. ZS2-4]MCY6354295.1 L-aspartate oxidase [Clostridium sp. ZS2-4]